MSVDAITGAPREGTKIYLLDAENLTEKMSFDLNQPILSYSVDRVTGRIGVLTRDGVYRILDQVSGQSLKEIKVFSDEYNYYYSLYNNILYSGQGFKITLF